VDTSPLQVLRGYDAQAFLRPLWTPVSLKGHPPNGLPRLSVTSSGAARLAVLKRPRMREGLVYEVPYTKLVSEKDR